VVGLRFVGFKLRDEEYRVLAEKAREEGVSVSEFVRRAVRATLNLPVLSQAEAGDRLSALEKRVGELERELDRIESLLSGATRSTPSAPAPAAEQHSKPRRSSWDILREQGVVCASAMKARDPDKVIDVLRDSGAVVVASESDRCAVYPDTWAAFVEALSKAGSPDEREVLGKLKGKAKQLFKMLRAAGAVYYDSKARRWAVDPSVVEEAGRAPGLAGSGGVEEAGGHVLRIPVEEAGDPEKYVAEMERRGWLCNEAGRQVVCVWRETLEQAVVDLNSGGAGAKDVEKVLAGDRAKLEVAKAAYEAGLLWYDSKQGKWRFAS
jgi:predicted CopG family antitoxin